MLLLVAAVMTWIAAMQYTSTLGAACFTTPEYISRRLDDVFMSPCRKDHIDSDPFEQKFCIQVWADGTPKPLPNNDHVLVKIVKPLTY